MDCRRASAAELVQSFESCEVLVAARMIAPATISTRHSPGQLKKINLKGSSNSLFTNF